MRTTVFEDHRSASDDEVLNIADELDAIIVTEDKDFGELTFSRTDLCLSCLRYGGDSQRRSLLPRVAS
ncbi:DUF5615 family PIN-like protein [Neolewinella sp.]|uniref:DUF5615 family PIN-like protein n=1 Tax=Neolewinella sp. TaxID=2993543 RepID=UPI003B51A66C